MTFEGDSVTGIMNPGPNSVPLDGVALDVTNWTVRIEAEGEDEAGGTVSIMAEGQLEDIHLYNRTITGTWHQGDVEGDFILTRD
jgi:hypothetical protein